MTRLFIDCESNDIITETQLYTEFIAFKDSQPQEYCYSFTDYIRNCTSKNGTLTEIVKP